MRSMFVNNVIFYIKKKDEVTDSDERIYRYTLESLYSFFTKNIIVLFLAIIFNVIIPTLLLMLVYGLIRFFAFGIHASKNLYCWIFTLFIYLLVPFLIQFSNFNNLQYFTLYLIFSILLIIFSPADTPKRPLIREDKRIRNKMVVAIITLGLLLLTLVIDNLLIKNVFLYAIILEAICVNPLIYKIFKIPFNNYLYYKKIQ